MSVFPHCQKNTQLLPTPAHSGTKTWLDEFSEGGEAF
jgi:hypothetical protein